MKKIMLMVSIFTMAVLAHAGETGVTVNLDLDENYVPFDSSTLSQENLAVPAKISSRFGMDDSGDKWSGVEPKKIPEVFKGTIFAALDPALLEKLESKFRLEDRKYIHHCTMNRGGAKLSMETREDLFQGILPYIQDSRENRAYNEALQSCSRSAIRNMLRIMAVEALSFYGLSQIGVQLSYEDPSETDIEEMLSANESSKGTLIATFKSLGQALDRIFNKGLFQSTYVRRGVPHTLIVYPFVGAFDVDLSGFNGANSTSIGFGLIFEIEDTFESVIKTVRVSAHPTVSGDATYRLAASFDCLDRFHATCSVSGHYDGDSEGSVFLGVNIPSLNILDRSVFKSNLRPPNFYN